MDAPGATVVWHPETVATTARDTLRFLLGREIGAQAYLAGGTALALRFGHRISGDLDFFNPELFDAETLVRRFAAPGFSVVSIAPHTLHATVLGTRVSFLAYPYPLLFPLAQFDGVSIADPRDIACMKLTAIASRGTKRDFVDFYLACRRFNTADILASFARKYAATRYSRVHLLKSLTFFDDAEKDPMPHMLIPLAWDEVKRFFEHEAPRMISGLPPAHAPI